MRTRRELILGGLVTIVFGGTQCACTRTSDSSGCLLSANDARLFGAMTPLQAGMGHGRISPRSGNREFDYALAQTLSMLVDTLQVFPNLAFFKDFHSHNAYAMPDSLGSQPDGTVLLGIRMLNFLFSSDNHPEIAVASICAHEFGHIVQFKHGLISALRGQEPTVRRIELHADFLAGYFAGMRKLARPNFPAVVFATTAFRFGDYAFGDPTHHGTPNQRASAIVRGFQAAYQERRTFTDAVKIGVGYVQSV